MKNILSLLKQFNYLSQVIARDDKYCHGLFVAFMHNTHSLYFEISCFVQNENCKSAEKCNIFIFKF